MEYLLNHREELLVRLKLECDITPENQKIFSNTTLTTKSLDDTNKLIVYNILKALKFHSTKPKRGGEKNSARMRDI